MMNELHENRNSESARLQLLILII